MTEKTIGRLPLPALAFGADGVLRSTRFDDIYFSRSGGAAETEHVFLNGNRLPAGWMNKESFTIGELGFGAGLNFLVTWKKFTETAPASHHLHYISFEQYPLTPEMLQSAHEDSPLAKELIAAYPLRLPGLHRIHLDRVTLTLVFGDARALLPQLEGGQVDAWFLDGFAPAKNPELWGEDIFREMARLSAPGASFATYSAAGAVRKGLEANGFTVEKAKGFAKKRDMLIGHRMGTSRSAMPARAGAEGEQGGAAAGAFLMPPAHKVRHIIVIGGGIAGCTIARALAARRTKVTLLEKGSIAGGASGNEAAVLYPQITKEWRAATEWHFTAYSFMLRQLRRWQKQGLSFAHGAPGMVKMPHDAAELAKLCGVNEALGLDPAIAEWMEAPALSQKLGMEFPAGGVWFPEGSWVAPAELCHALVQHPNITLREHVAVTSLERTGGSWRVSAGGESFSAAHVVLATAQETAKLLPHLSIPIGISAGQVSTLAGDAVRAPLPFIFCHKGYVIPRGNNYLIGATYDHDDLSGAVTEANHLRNLAELEKALPGWVRNKNLSAGRTSLRATTPDRLPYVGAVDDGLYVSIGHGSRGMLSAPLAAEVLASQIGGEFVPLTESLRKAIAPLRRHTASTSVEAKPSRVKIAL